MTDTGRCYLCDRRGETWRVYPKATGGAPLCESCLARHAGEEAWPIAMPR